MATKTSKDTRTIMYSVDGEGGVITHRLPWPKDSEKLSPLKARGFTFERPVVDDSGSTTSTGTAKTRIETIQDKRIAALEKARAAKAAKKGT